MTDEDDLPPLPPFVEHADADAIVQSMQLTHNRTQLIQRIGDVVGFDHDPDRDRLTKEELAQIAVWVLAMNRDL